MKIHTTFKALILSTVSALSKDGKTTYYKASLMDLQSKEAGTIGCTEEVALTLAPMTSCECTAVFDSTYNSFRIIHTVLLPDQQSGGVPVNSSGTKK